MLGASKWLEKTRPVAEDGSKKTYDRDTVIYADDLELSQKISYSHFLVS